MKVMIRCDVEGVTGVVHPSQAEPGSPGFAYGVGMLHNDVNAAVEGFFAAGAREVWIYDMHCGGLNLDMGRLDPRVRVVCGKPFYEPGDVGGLTPDFGAQALVGLHSMAGTGGLLCHSYESEIESVRINGVPVGEIGVEAALAGEMGVPTVMVSGDSAGCAEAESLIPGVVAAVVKVSKGPRAGICLPAARTREIVASAARRALLSAKEIAPYRIAGPPVLEMRFADGPFAVRVMEALPDCRRPGGTVRIEAETLAAAWRRYLAARP